MARQKNDGRGRLGGRAKGTPNKSTQTLKNWLSKVLDNQRETFENDLKELLPEERVRLLSNLFGYIIPKQQALSVEEQVSLETETLTRWFSEAPEEAVDRIAERVMYLQSVNGPERGKDEQ